MYKILHRNIPDKVSLQVLTGPSKPVLSRRKDYYADTIILFDNV
jgi:hypothetical protein